MRAQNRNGLKEIATAQLRNATTRESASATRTERTELQGRKEHAELFVAFPLGRLHCGDFDYELVLEERTGVTTHASGTAAPADATPPRSAHRPANRKRPVKKPAPYAT